jgi:hypothetical protein
MSDSGLLVTAYRRGWGGYLFLQNLVRYLHSHPTRFFNLLSSFSIAGDFGTCIIARTLVVKL